MQMSVFRQDGQRSSQRRDTNHPSQASAHRSRTPHPQVPASVPAAYDYSAQPQVPASSGGLASPVSWDPSLGTTFPTPDVRSAPFSGNAYPDYVQPMNPPTSSQPYGTPGQWMVQFNFGEGRRHRQPVPMQMHQVPELQCRCGTHIRIVHLPTLVNWTPPFGVLWNFKVNGKNGWFEGSFTDTCVSTAKCPTCNAFISLHCPAGGSAA